MCFASAVFVVATFYHNAGLLPISTLLITVLINETDAVLNSTRQTRLLELAFSWSDGSSPSDEFDTDDDAVETCYEQLLTRMPQEPRPKSYDYWEKVFPMLNDTSPYNSFQESLQIDKNDVRSASGGARDSSSLSEQKGDHVPVDIQIAVAIWRFANGSSVRCLEQNLGFSQGSIANFTDRFLKAILSRSDKYIRWPRTPEEFDAVKCGFAESRDDDSGQLTDCIGAIDGSLIQIVKPANSGSMYVDRKNHFSIGLMAICDASCRFTCISVGQSGSVHDARSLKRSKIWQRIKDQDPAYFPDKEYIIGDAAFPLTPNLIVPYDISPSMDRVNKQFNFVHSSTRMAVERAFGILKNRFRCLHLGFNIKPQRAIKTICACVILHNLSLQSGDLFESNASTQSENVRPDEETSVEVESMSSGRAAQNLLSGGRARRDEVRREYLARDFC